jgi:AcrR family transcriptional regulator
MDMTRMAAADRRRQITEAALEVIAQQGIQGTTTARVAEAAGISPASIYKHFENRDELLLAALDLLYDHIEEMLFESSAELPMPERLRSVSVLHSGLISSGRGSFIYPLFEFLAAPPEIGLREAQGIRQLRVIENLARMIEEAKSQGTVRANVDSEQVAWELHAVFWAEDISHLLGLAQFVSAGRSRTIFNNILARISNGHQTEDPADAWQDDLREIRRLLALCPLAREGDAEG